MKSEDNFTCISEDCKLHKVKGNYCAKHFILNKPNLDKISKNKFWYHKFYYRNSWKLLRKKKLSHNPLCEKCGAIGSEIDHILNHKGNQDLFFDFKNLQTLCKKCHSRKTMREINARNYKSIDEIVIIKICNTSDLEKIIKTMNIKNNEEYALSILVKGSTNLKFKVKSFPEAKKIENAFIHTNRIKPFFKIIHEV